MREGDPGPPDDDTDREKMSLWCNYEEGKVGIRVQGMEKLMDPDEARERADGLEERFSGTEAGEDPETKRFIEDLRERADQVESAGGDDE